MNISDTLFTSSPSPDNRLEKEIAVYKLLDSLDIAYTGIDHDEAATIALQGNRKEIRYRNLQKSFPVQLTENRILSPFNAG